jgi:hypothetical protein
VAKSERNYEKLGKVCEEEKVNVEKNKMMVMVEMERKENRTSKRIH